MIDTILPPTYDYLSCGQYTAVVIFDNGRAVVKSKRRLRKAFIAMWRAMSTDIDGTVYKAIIDGRGYVLYSSRRGGSMMGCGEAFGVLNVLADEIGAGWMHDDLLSFELESRILWPAVTA